jgi:WD40 repeat protein
MVLSHGAWVRALVVLADGRLASGGADGKIRLWPTEGNVEPVVLAPGSEVDSLAVLTGGRLASGGKDGEIKLWSKDGAGEPVVLSHGRVVWTLAVLADGRLASGGGDGKIKLWPKDGMGDPVVLSHGGPVLSLVVLPDGRLASAGDDRNIKLWLVDDQKLIAALCLRAGRRRQPISVTIGAYRSEQSSFRALRKHIWTEVRVGRIGFSPAHVGRQSGCAGGGHHGRAAAERPAPGARSGNHSKSRATKSSRDHGTAGETLRRRHRGNHAAADWARQPISARPASHRRMASGPSRACRRRSGYVRRLECYP